MQPPINEPMRGVVAARRELTMTESRTSTAEVSTIVTGVALTVLAGLGLIALLSLANRAGCRARCRRSNPRMPAAGHESVR